MRRAAAVLLSICLAACGTAAKSKQTPALQHAGVIRVGVELPLLTSPFWQAYDDYLAQYAPRYGIALLPPSNANGDTGKFLADVQDFVTEGVSGLVLSPTDTAAVGTAVDRAAQAKIPIVTVDVAPDRGRVFMVVRADNRAYGEKACRYIGTHVGAGNVVQIEGDLASINGRDRTAAFDDCMRSSYPRLHVLQIAAQWDGDKAAQGLEALFAANPGIRAIYMQAGGVYLSPTISFLRRHGALIPAGKAGHVVIVSNDGIPQELDAIRKGWIDATVSQPADAYARYGLYYVRAAIDGKSFTPGPTKHGSTIVRLPSGMLEDQLPAPLITKSNVDSRAFWGNSVAGF